MPAKRGVAAPNRIDLVGKKFGRLRVIRYVDTQKKSARWECLCKCGTKTVVGTGSLRSGNTRSCGCLIAETAEKLGKAGYWKAAVEKIRVHGDAYTKPRLYRIWMNMNHRCSNPNSPIWKWYGGKGVRVCRLWKSDYPAFKKWALGNGYRDTLSLDRINGSGNYEPRNCRWCDRKTQARNSSKNVNITWRGETMCIAAWAERTGIKADRISYRFRKGWSVERMLTVPPRKSAK